MIECSNPNIYDWMKITTKRRCQMYKFGKLYSICVFCYGISIYISHSNCTNLFDSSGISFFCPSREMGERKPRKKCKRAQNAAILWCFSNFPLQFARSVLCHFRPLAVRSLLQFNLLAWSAHTHSLTQFAFNICTAIDCVKSLRYYLHLYVWLWQVLFLSILLYWALSLSLTPRFVF